MKKILISGSAGFIASHLIEHILKNTDWLITCLDRFDAAGTPNRLSDMLETTDVDRSRVKFVFWDLKAELNAQVTKQLVGGFDYIAHLAAGSHVDRSIDEPLLFFQDNCIGTVNFLNYARDGGLAKAEDGTITGKFLYFSTDEVYGPYPMDAEGGFKEWDRLNPNNPYSAAKAAAEMAVIAYANTYRIPSIITNTMNVIGQRQSPEKFIPLVINKMLNGEKLYIHADKTKTQAGKRHYLHARNISSATLWILENGELLDGSATQGRYNIVGDVEMDNLAFALKIAGIVKDYESEHGRDVSYLAYELVDFHSSRPGHDLRYALDGTKLKDIGFSYPVTFEESLRETIYWTLDHRDQWL
jgi:dTDP-glucose 4,6-dehydratase